VYADVEAVKKAGGPGAAALFASNWFGEQDGVRVSGAMGTGSMLAMLVRSDCPVRHTLCTYMVPCVSYREGCVCIASAVPTYLPTYSCTYLQPYLPTAVPTYLPTYLPTAVPIHTQPSLYDTQCVSHTVQIYRGYSTV
jgi:hypothetical protein